MTTFARKTVSAEPNKNSAHPPRGHLYVSRAHLHNRTRARVARTGVRCGDHKSSMKMSFLMIIYGHASAATVAAAATTNATVTASSAERLYLFSINFHNPHYIRLLRDVYTPRCGALSWRINFSHWVRERTPAQRQTATTTAARTTPLSRSKINKTKVINQ